jgi:16S rRNA (guanine966-N2)-methyltransferase
MRILGGKYKGKFLSAGNTKLIRPLTNRIKDSIFNTLDDFFVNKTVLDLFAGSGSFGIEAYSRGASHITFVERSVALLRHNLHALNIPDNETHILKTDVVQFCQNSSNCYDLIFTDPPFNFKMLQSLIDLIIHVNLLNPEGLIILHHEISNPIATSHTLYHVFKQRQFGRSLISYIIPGETHV